MEQVYIIQGVKQVYFFPPLGPAGNENWMVLLYIFFLLLNYGHGIGGIR